MNWLKNLLSTEKKATETPEIGASGPSAVIYKKSTEGTFEETKGDQSSLAFLAPMAAHACKSIMAAAAKNGLTAKDEPDIRNCLELLNKILEIRTNWGAAYGMRADIYMIKAQLDRDGSLLERAEQDYKKALDNSADRASNEKGLENVKILKELFDLLPKG